MSEIEWKADRSFAAVGYVDGEPVASVMMREPGTYLAQVKLERKVFETEQEAFSWCEKLLRSPR